jgi:hypothetical protein
MRVFTTKGLTMLDDETSAVPFFIVSWGDDFERGYSEWSLN